MSRSRNFHEIGAEAVLDDILRHHTAAVVLADTWNDLREETRFPADYVDMIGQLDPREGGWLGEQVAAFLVVHAGLMSGRFAQVMIEVGSCPLDDQQRTENATAIANLPEPFTAMVDMDQHCDSIGDGWLKWVGAITVERSTGEGEVSSGGETKPVISPCLIQPRFSITGVPMEIGLTKPSVTLGHLMRHCGVARWSYGSPILTLLLNMNVFEG